MFMVAASTIANTCKQPRCLSVGERINYYSEIVESYSALKRNKLLTQEKTLREFKCALLSEKTQSEKAAYYDFNLMTFWKGKTMMTAKRLVVANGDGV